jgi:predicted porin
MKKIVLALIAAFSSTAYAQSSVIIYGIVDAGIVVEKGGVASTGAKLASGVASPSRIGFRGTEALGDGLSALFVLETGMKVDTGEIDAAGTIFNRQAYVGLASATAGTLTMGRQYTPMYITLSTVADPFAAGLAGSAKNMLPSAGALARTSNTLQYATPKTNGFSGTVAYSLGEQANGGTQAGRQYGAVLAYGKDDVNVHLAYNNRDSSVATGTGAVPVQIGRNLLLAGNVTVNGNKLFGAIARNRGINSATLPNTGTPYGGVKPTSSTDSVDWLVGFTMPVSGGSVIGSYIRNNDKTSFNQDASQLAIGYVHRLSTRSNIYTSFAHIKNSNGAGYTVGHGSEAGTGNRAFNLGLRHSF